MADMLPRLSKVGPGATPLTLDLTWSDRAVTQVDLSGIVHEYKAFSPLREDADLFNQVRLGEFGTDVVWTDQIDISADTLWRLAGEQRARPDSDDSGSPERSNRGGVMAGDATRKVTAASG